MNPGIKNGLIVGLLSIIIGLIIYFINPKLLFNGWYMLFGFVLFFGFMAKGAIDARSENGGFISFGAAFMAAWLVAIVSLVITSLWQFIFTTLIDPSLIELQQEASLEYWGGIMESWGVMDAEDFYEQAEAQGGAENATNPFFILIGILCGSLMMAVPAAIMGLIFKRENKNPIL